MKRLLNFIALLAALLLLSGCAAETGVPMDRRWANVSGGKIEKAQAGEAFYFTIPVDQRMLEPKAVPIRIQVSGIVKSGQLRFELRRPDGKPAWDSGSIGPGDYSITTNFVPEQDQTGQYSLGLVHQANTSASYNLSWHALQLTPAVLVPGTGMLLVALGFVVYNARRRLGWRYLGLGALFWALTVALKFAFATLVNPPLYRSLNVSPTDLFSPANLVAYIYIGALTGIFEAGVAWLILRKSRWGRAAWPQALSFGIGFGVIEAVVLGVSSFGTASFGLLSPNALPVPTLGGLAQANNLLVGLAPIVERLSVIFAHTFACVLIFYAIASGKPGWAWLSILYKTLLDIPAGFASFWGLGTPDRLWTIEAVIIIFGLIGLWGTLMIARRYPSQAPQPAPVTEAVQAV